MKKTRWIVQNNLISQVDFNKIKEACNELDVEMESIEIIPFSNNIPPIVIDDHINIYYGATTFMYEVYNKFNKPKGLFFDSSTFSMKNYLSTYGRHMLSSDAITTTFKDFSSAEHKDDDLFFVRPDADDKSFNGEVRTFYDIKHFIENAIKVDNVILTEDTKILVGEPYNIKKEWRNFIVNGKVVSSSLYRQNFKLKKDGNNIPLDMVAFVEDRCKEYTPHDVFVMDVALCGDEYYIIECGCFNSVGFYHSDVKKIIKEVDKFVKNNY